MSFLSQYELLGQRKYGYMLNVLLFFGAFHCFLDTLFLLPPPTSKNGFTTEEQEYYMHVKLKKEKRSPAWNQFWKIFSFFSQEGDCASVFFLLGFFFLTLTS